MNGGKMFEKQFKDSAMNQGIFIHRIKDTDLSFNGNSVSSYTPKNPCDFYLFGNVKDGRGNLIGIECKSTKYKSVSIQREEGQNAMIQLEQINSLVNMAYHDAIFAGFLINFRDDDNFSFDDTYFIHIEDFSRFLEESDKKSINKLDLIQYDAIRIESYKKRKYYTYNVAKMIRDICVKNEY